MALRVWLPLNGSLENIGISDTKFVSGTPSYKAGKISNQALNLNNRITFDCANLANLKTFSICFWGMTEASSTLTTDWQDLLGFTDVSSGGSNGTFRWETCYNYNAPGIHWHDNATNALVNGSVAHIATRGTWCHCCVVFDFERSKVYSYTNGVRTAEYAHLGGHFNANGRFYLGETNNIEGRINDVRFYDHALSAKEVKEIAQGLALHYKLDNIYNSFPKIWSLDSYSRTADLTTSNTYIYSIPTKTVYLTPGKQYTVGAEIRVNQDNISFYFDSNCTDENGVYSGNDAAQTVQYNPSVTLQKNKWIPVWITTTIKADAGKPYYHHGFLFKTISGTTTTLCEIRNIQVYEGAEKLQARPFDATNIIADSSGYGNDGAIVGTLETITDSARYDISTKWPNNTATYIYTSGLKQQIFTWSCWFKILGEGATTSQRILSEGRDTGSRGVEIWASKAGTTLYAQAHGVQFNTTITLNTWYNTAIACDGTTMFWYLNGTLINSGNYTADIDYAQSGDSFVIGKMAYEYTNSAAYFPLNGQVSDVRIYCTALSANDILDLYHTPLNADNLGNMHTFEFAEDSGYSIGQNGLTHAARLGDDLFSKHTAQIGKEINPNMLSGYYSVVTDKNGNTTSGSISTVPAATMQSLAGSTLILSYDVCAPGDRYSTENGLTAWNQVRYGIHGSMSYTNGSGTAGTAYPFAGYLEYSGNATRVYQSWTIPTGYQSYGNLSWGIQPYDKPASTNNNIWYIRNVKLELATTPTPYVDSAWMTTSENGWITGTNLIEK